MQSRLRRTLAVSPLARIAAMPLRTVRVARYDVAVVGRSLSWLVRNRETTNFTYDLDSLNHDQLCWFVATVTGAGIGQVRSWMAELETDTEFHASLTRRMSMNPTRGAGTAGMPSSGRCSPITSSRRELTSVSAPA
jgi:hypothetical protein